MSITYHKLYWVVVCFSACPIGCSKSHQASTTADAEVDRGNSQTNGSGTDDADFKTDASSDARIDDDGASGATDSVNADVGGPAFDSGSSGSGQGSGGGEGNGRDDLDDYEPYNELTISPIPRPVCPETPPTEGTECTHPDLQCGYGTTLRADCRKVYLCRSDGTWWLNDSFNYGCKAPPENACPEIPSPGEPCELSEATVISGIICEYDGFTLCTCTTEQRTDTWQCFEPPSDARCPPIMPNFGEGCDVQALECIYNEPCINSGGIVFCRRGAWERSFQICMGY